MKTLVQFIMFVLAMPKTGIRLGMALVKLGGGVADIRGSIGGTVFSRNRYGAYMRNRTIPIDRGTIAQVKIRAIMGHIRDAWFSALTTAQKAAWDTYAANVNVVNRLGETTNLTGWNMFCRTAAMLMYNDLAIIEDAPTTFSLAEQDGTITITPDDSSQNIAIAFDEALAWAKETGAYLAVYVSPPQNPTVNFYKGRYRLAGKVAGVDSTGAQSPATVTVPFEVAVGQKVFAQFRIVRKDGRLSSPFRCSGIVVS